MFTFAQIKFPLTLNSAYDDVNYCNSIPSSLISITRRHPSPFFFILTLLFQLRCVATIRFVYIEVAAAHLDLDTNLPLTTWAANNRTKVCHRVIKKRNIYDCASMCFGEISRWHWSPPPAHIPARPGPKRGPTVQTIETYANHQAPIQLTNKTAESHVRKIDRDR